MKLSSAIEEKLAKIMMGYFHPTEAQIRELVCDALDEYRREITHDAFYSGAFGLAAEIKKHIGRERRD